MKESLGPQEGLGDLHILICRDILPLALLEGEHGSIRASMAPLHEERSGWKPSPRARNAVAKERTNVVLRGQDHIPAWLVTSVQSDVLSGPRRGSP